MGHSVWGHQKVMVQGRGERDMPKAGWRWLPGERGEQQKLGDFAVLLTVRTRKGQTRSEAVELGFGGPGKPGSCGTQRQEKRRTMESGLGVVP